MPEDDEAGLIPGLQRPVNVRQQQWKDWEAELRKTYARERGRFQAAIEEARSRSGRSCEAAERGQAVRLAAAGDALRAQTDAAPMDEQDMEFDALMGLQDP